jgi:hypothetical protein
MERSCKFGIGKSNRERDMVALCQEMEMDTLSLKF